MQIPRTNPRHPVASLSVRVATPWELSSRDIEAWIDLESRAAEPNAYLSPHFVLPAARYLDPLAQPLVFQIERSGRGQRELLGLAVLTRSAPSRRFPISHLTAYQSRHSFLSGLLLDRGCVEQGVEALLDHVRRESGPHGIELPQIWADGPLARAIGSGSGAASGRSLHHDATRDQRAVLRPAEAGPQLLKEAHGTRMKGLERRMRRLKERGDVAWRCHREGGVPDSVVEAFLALEHAGWKGEHGTSLRSRPADEAFFKQMVAGFAAEGRALFTELTLDGVAIASISNFISGNVGFGFKIGWAPEFKDFSPGMLNELEFIRHAPQAFADISYFDSGSSADAYISSLWPGRAALATASVTTTPLARVLTDAAKAASHLKRSWKGSRLHPAAVHVSKPEWVSLAGEGLSSLAVLF